MEHRTVHARNVQTGDRLKVSRSFDPRDDKWLTVVSVDNAHDGSEYGVTTVTLQNGERRTLAPGFVQVKREGSIELATEYLAALTDWRRMNDAEPPTDDDGMPLNPARWQRWYDAWKPVNARLGDATDSFRRQCAPDVASTHPMNLEPIAKEVVHGA